MTIPKQRVNNSNIRKVLIPANPTKSKLKHINSCRMYIDAIFLSDIVTEDGRSIITKYFTDKNYKTQLNWPQIPKQPKIT